MVEVPWRNARAEAEAASSRSAKSFQSDTGSREDVIFIPQDSDVSRQEEPLAQPLTSSIPHGPQVGESLVDRDQIMVSDRFNAQEASHVEIPSSTREPSKNPGFTTLTADASDKPSAVPSDTSAAEAGNATDEKPSPERRTLALKHFEVALGEIRPSSSEEGSLPELRKVNYTLREKSTAANDVQWAEQFGEGGTQRGRKKGFGKGFGFSEAGNRDIGYGKVAQDG